MNAVVTAPSEGGFIAVGSSGAGALGERDAVPGVRLETAEAQMAIAL